MNPRGTGNRSINDIMPMIGARFYNQLDSANARAELLENCLAREIENGRLFRLIVKLCTVVERNEYVPFFISQCYKSLLSSLLYIHFCFIL